MINQIAVVYPNEVHHNGYLLDVVLRTLMREIFHMRCVFYSYFDTTLLLTQARSYDLNFFRGVFCLSFIPTVYQTSFFYFEIDPSYSNMNILMVLFCFFIHIDRFIHSFFQSLIHLLSHSFTHLFIHSFTHLFIQSYALDFKLIFFRLIFDLISSFISTQYTYSYTFISIRIQRQL